MKASKSPLRLSRIVIAALVAELIPILVLMIAITSYAYFIAPNQAGSSYQDFANRAGKIINPIAGSLATFGMAYWAARKPENAKIMHGIVTGIVVIFIELAILARPEAVFGVPVLLRMAGALLAGALGGWAAQKYTQTKHTPGHRIL